MIWSKKHFSKGYIHKYTSTTHRLNQTLWIMHDNALLMQYHYQKWNIALFHYWFYNNALMQYCIIIFWEMHYFICINFFHIFWQNFLNFKIFFINFKKHCLGNLIHNYLLYRYSDINKQSMMKIVGLGKSNELAYIFYLENSPKCWKKCY